VAPEDAPKAPGKAAHWQLSRFPINWDSPESQIPTIEERNQDPLQFGYFLQDLNVEALKAERLGDWGTAAKFWRANAKAVPDMAVGFSKTCRAYQMLGKLEEAMHFCAHALNLEGSTVEDYLRLAELSTSRSAALSPLDIQDLDAMVKHLQETQQVAPAAVIECRVGVKLEDRVRLERCTQVLKKTSPNDPHSLTFQWSYAMLRKDYGDAKRLVNVMGRNGMAPQALAQVREVTAREGAWWRRPFKDWRYGVPLAVSLLVALVLVLRWRRRSAGSGPSAGVAPASA
jgi:hypothetical protein